MVLYTETNVGNLVIVVGKLRDFGSFINLLQFHGEVKVSAQLQKMLWLCNGYATDIP